MCGPHFPTAEGIRIKPVWLTYIFVVGEAGQDNRQEAERAGRQGVLREGEEYMYYCIIVNKIQNCTPSQEIMFKTDIKL